LVVLRPADTSDVEPDARHDQRSRERRDEVEPGETNLADHEMRRTEEAQERIAEAFNRYFGQFGIRIVSEDAAVGTRRSIGAKGWRIQYCVDADDSGLPSLEYYAQHRMTNDRHVLIWADGYRQHLEAMEDFITYDPNIPGAREAAHQARREHDRAVEKQLRARGIYPDSGIGAYAGVGAIISDDEADISGPPEEEDDDEPPA
jgi:hypothetical protein